MSKLKKDVSIEQGCEKCGAPLSSHSHECPACFTTVGAPNVRQCSAASELDALLARYNTAARAAESRGAMREFRAFEQLLIDEGRVVVSLPAGVAHSLFSDPRMIYENYESLVAGGARVAAAENLDRDRCGAGGLLFGSYASKIRYGVLSLDCIGLPTYGDLYCELKLIAIQDRTTLLETNSYDFVKTHNLTVGNPMGPPGYQATWENRHLLALAKLGDQVLCGSTRDDWQQLLVKSDSINRANDDFIEAIIYGTFNAHSIVRVEPIGGRKMNKHERLLVKAAMEAFQKGAH